MTVAITSARTKRRERSRAAIRDAAREILDLSDPSAFTARAVAERAGVSPALVMQHFSSMADLALDVFMEANADLTHHIERVLSGASPWRDAVFEVFRTVLTRDLSRRALTGRIMAYAWSWSPDHEARFQESVQAVFHAMLKVFAKDLPGADESARYAAAAALITIYNGFLRTAVAADQDVETALARMQPSMMMVLDGLAAGA